MFSIYFKKKADHGKWACLVKNAGESQEAAEKTLALFDGASKLVEFEIRGKPGP